MKNTIKRCFALILLAMAVTVSPSPALAFKHVAVGAKLPNAKLKSLSGQEVQVLEKGSAVNVFLFVRPDHRHSEDALSVMARMCNQFSKRGVHCVAIFSDVHGKKAVEQMVGKAGWIKNRSLIDAGDAYYGRLGVVLHPSFGVADRARKLRAYDPYSGINSFRVVVAHILFVLGDINEKQLQLEINPAPTDSLESGDRAMTRYNYARVLFESGLFDEALKQAKNALKLDNKLVQAHGLLGLIYASKKQCARAKPSIQKALELDKDNADAKRARSLCK